jgi:hypothetical protein
MKLTPILDQILLEKVEDVKWLQKSYYFAAMGYLPLTPNIAKILNGEKRMQVFHVTDADNTNRLKALEGTKKTVSAMNRIPIVTREDITGVWGNGVMFSMDGTVIINAKGDINSSPDESGRRWINLSDFSPYSDSKFAREFKDYLMLDKRLATLRKKLMKDYEQPGTIKDIKLSLSGKELNEFLTLYITRAMEWLKASSPDIGNHSDEIIRLAQSDTLTGVSDYNEILVNQIKLTAAIVNVVEMEDMPKSRIAKLRRDIESAVGKENVLYVDSYKDSKGAKAAIDKFILFHGGKIK